MAQALIGFLRNQHVERDGRENRFFAGAWGIFGHGIIAGIGQALQQTPEFPYYLCRNEQGAVHIATAFAKASNRLRAFVCTSSIGPGATNMITGAATATINRIPVLLLPGDLFARRNVAPVLQQLESEHSQDISVNDAFKPVSRYWDRINRPDQLPCAVVEAMRGHPRPSAGRAGGSLGLPGRNVPKAGLAHSPARARTGSDRARRRTNPRRPPSFDRGRRRRDLQRSVRGSGAVLRKHRNSRG
jgi:TPP-dependent trihydroxycyclohexane-1,2-dione (THcHDO) dehydratase